MILHLQNMLRPPLDAFATGLSATITLTVRPNHMARSLEVTYPQA